MSDLRQDTVDTYNKSAKELAKYFRGIGPRIEDIDLALNLAAVSLNARVVEIGCGDGRDAKEITKRVSWYVGFDISAELIKLARKHVPSGEFLVADLADFVFPADLDVVYAFASLLHSDKDEVEDVIKRAHKALKPGGIFLISLKNSPVYKSEIKDDKYGKRLFYYYNPKLIEKLAGVGYKTERIKRSLIGHTEWFEMALRKTS